MIARFSWRRADCTDVDPATGTTGGAAEHLLTTDAGNVTVLHLDPGGSTPVEQGPVGQLVVVVAGDGTVQVGDEEVEVETGDAVRLPARVPHGIRTSRGLSAVVVSHDEPANAWRVLRVDRRTGRRWVAGVFGDTGRARSLRDRLRDRLPEETIGLE